MNGWTPRMVMELPTSVHAALVEMLRGDDKANESKPANGLTINESFNDR